MSVQFEIDFPGSGVCGTSLVAGTVFCGVVQSIVALRGHHHREVSYNGKFDQTARVSTVFLVVYPEAYRGCHLSVMQLAILVGLRT